MTTENIGKKILYHATNRDAYESIMKTKSMILGKKGLFGPGIYFAETEESAQHKSKYDGGVNDVIIKAEVDVGTALVLESSEGPDESYKEYMNFELVKSYECNSIKGRSNPNALWEYVLFEPERIMLLGITLNGIEQRYISEIGVIINSGVPAGYMRFPQDLNEGSKRSGNHVYVVYKETNLITEAIGDICLDFFSDAVPSGSYITSHVSAPAEYIRCGADLNSGAHGKYIYLYYCRTTPAGKLPITQLGSMTSGYDYPAPLSGGWEWVCWKGTSQPADTNKGAKGNYVFLKIKRG
jgi:hypothetical protein